MTTTSSDKLERLQVTLGRSPEATALSGAEPIFQPTIREENHAHIQVDYVTLPVETRHVWPTVLLLAATPLVVLATMAAGIGLVLAVGGTLYAWEMLAAAGASLVAGMLAVLPMIMAVQHGDKLAQAALAGIGIRVVVLLGGLLLAMGPSWHLATQPLVFWVLGFYFPLLAAETATMAWLMNRQD